MSERGEATPEACIFASDVDVRRDLRIYLGQNLGLNVRVVEEADPAGMVLDFSPRLFVIASAADPGAALDLVRRLREGGARGFILYIAAADLPDEGGDAFGAGADDVIRAPFSLRELGLRLRLRLGDLLKEDGKNLCDAVPQVMIDAGNRVHAMGSRAAAQLTPAEAEVMAVLIRSGGEIVSRNDLSRAIYRADWQYGDRRFDVHVASIRKKLRQAFGARYELRAIRYRGYAFVEGHPADST